LDARKKSRGKSIKDNWTVKMIDELSANHNYHLIIVSVPHYSIKEAVNYLSSRVGKATVLFFCNFWKEPLDEIAILPQEQLVWGFPKAGGGFDKSGKLIGAFLDKVTFGTFGKAPTERHKEVIQLFQSAGFKTKENNDFRSWLFKHFIFIASLQLEALKDFNGTPPSEQFKSTYFWKNAKLNSKELMLLLKARNVDLTVPSELGFFALPSWVIKFIMKMGMTFSPPLKRSLDFHTNPYELKAFCNDVWQSGNDFNINLERFEDGKLFFQEKLAGTI